MHLSLEHGKLNSHPNKHLTYCTNIHPGEDWNEVLDQLKLNIPELKNRLSPQKPFGIGLRLSAAAARQLLSDNKLQLFKQWLSEENLYVFTINGFPYGNFHGQVVKEDVYRPDWCSAKRVKYTLNLVKILTELLPDWIDGGISTSPLSYKYWFNTPTQTDKVFQQGTIHLAQIAYELSKIRKEVGKEIHIDLEPEPDCLLENSRETISFYEDWLFPHGSRFINKHYGISIEKAKDIIRTHIRVCYDTCHFAVEYEQPENAISAFEKAGIRIGKVQISAALKVMFDSSIMKETIISKLGAFEEDTYLHQVIELRKNGSLYQYRDLGEVFRAWSDPQEWRIHYHVPIFVDRFDGLGSTQDDIKKSLDMILDNSSCTHFEIETYTWTVLPKMLKKNIIDSIEREYDWLLSQID